MKLMIINGPNIDMLGIREPEIYGTATYDDLVSYIKEERGEGNELFFVQSNHEGDLVEAIHKAHFESFDGIVMNPAAYGHTSIAIMDALKSVSVPCVEVHISDPGTREEYRHHTFSGEAAAASVVGKGFAGYIEAIDILKEIVGK